VAAFVAANTTWNTTAGSKGVAPTPNVGEIFVVICAAAGVASGLSCSDNQTGGTYTLIGTLALNNTSVDSFGVFVRNNLVTLAATVHSITAGGQTASTGGGLCAMRISGMTRAGAAAVRSVGVTAQFAKQENQAAGTPAPVFPTAPLSANMCIGAVLTASNSTTNTIPPTGWAEQADVGFNTPTTGLEVATRDSGETNTTISWTGATATGFASIIIELDASSFEETRPRRDTHASSLDFDPWSLTGWQASA
jgi:hypothetical protein